jgi:hypothetical protein
VTLPLRRGDGKNEKVCQLSRRHDCFWSLVKSESAPVRIPKGKFELKDRSVVMVIDSDEGLLTSSGDTSGTKERTWT